ncbi:MAG: M24 family metallopeptidase [Thermomicrobiales bacterium]
MKAQLTEEQELRRDLVAEKHAQARSLLRETGIDCWLTFCREGSDLLLPFVTGGEYLVGTSALMIFADGPSVAVVADYDVSQVDAAFDTVLPYSMDWRKPFLAALRDRNPAKIGINYAETDFGIDGLTHGLYLLLTKTLAPIGMAGRLVSAELISEPVRAIKTPSEIERMRRACTITQRIFDDVTTMLKPGLTEAEIAEIMRERMQTYNVLPAWEASFCPSVASSRSRRGHTPPGAVVLNPGDALAIDFGVVHEGYCSDMQRTWYFRKQGEKGAPKDLQHAFDAVRDGILLAASLIKPGVRGYEVDDPARALVAKRGFTFTHALGHQLGRMAHDGGMVLGPDNARYGDRSGGEIAAGMVFTLEPCIGAIGLEDDVVVTERGCDFLFPTQENIYLV